MSKDVIVGWVWQVLKKKKRKNKKKKEKYKIASSGFVKVATL